MTDCLYNVHICPSFQLRPINTMCSGPRVSVDFLNYTICSRYVWRMSSYHVQTLSSYENQYKNGLNTLIFFLKLVTSLNQIFLNLEKHSYSWLWLDIYKREMIKPQCNILSIFRPDRRWQSGPTIHFEVSSFKISKRYVSELGKVTIPL